MLERLLKYLIDENIIYFIRVISGLEDQFLFSYSYWLTIHILLKANSLNGEIKINDYNFDVVVKVSKGGYFFYEDSNICYRHNSKNLILKTNITFLKSYYIKFIEEKLNNYFTVTNFFNVGKIYRRKSDINLTDDYPHYYKIVLENDPQLELHAMRESENSSFTISKSAVSIFFLLQDDFTKYGINYVGEIVPNFWGTNFEIYDFGLEKSLYEKSCKEITKLREMIGVIKYETNIMGECPRYFSVDVYNQNKVYKFDNLKPEWNQEMECYCLNFYGRVKKASARNFQLVFPDDEDNIILQHGKINSNEFNIDYREPFNLLQAFACSLASIGRKRVVS